MAVWATRALFQPTTPEEFAQAWYGQLLPDGTVINTYGHAPKFGRRADWIQANYAPGQVLVIGCGPGAFLVSELLDRGFDAYGIDPQDKLGNSGFDGSLIDDPRVLTRCLWDADATDNSDVARIKGKNYLDIKGQQKVHLVVTEDMLPVLADSECAFLTNYLTGQAINVLHIVSPLDLTTSQMPQNWKTLAQWRALLDANNGITHRLVDMNMLNET